MKRQVATVGVALLLLLGGCSGLGGGGGSTATPSAADAPTPTPTQEAGDAQTETPASTDAPTTGEQTPAETDAPTPDGTDAPTPTTSADLAPVSSMESLPPGVSADGVTDERALFGAHRDGVTAAGTAFQVAVRNATDTLITVERANDTGARRISLTAGTGEQLAYYFADPVYATYNTTDGDVGYAHGDVPLAGESVFIDIAVTGLGNTWLRAVEWEPVGVETVDGEQRLVLNGTGLNRTEAQREGTLLPALASGDGEGNPSLDARMAVTESGLVRHANVTLSVERNGTTAAKIMEVTTRPFTDDVSEPSWLADAPRVELDAEESGRLLAFDHTGGPTIESGTDLSVIADGEGVGNVTLPTAVEEGDTVYVHRTGDGSLAVSVNDRPTVPDSATAFEGQVLVTGSQGVVTFRTGVDREQQEE